MTTDDAAAGPDLLEDGSLCGRWLRRWGERPAWLQLRDTDARWLASDEIEQLTRERATRLQAAGLEPGDRFVICAGSSADLVLAHIACLRAGLVVVPINPAYTRDEVTRIVKRATPAGAAVDVDQRARWIEDACPDPIAIFGVGLDRGSGSRDPSALDRAASEDPALLVFTSGTTGEPKGALLSHGNLLSSATAVNAAWRWEPGERLLLTLPLFHVHGLGVGVFGSLCAGGSIVLRAKFDAADIAAHCEAGAELFFGVPTMYQQLLASGNAGALRAVRLLVCGSAPLAAKLAEDVARSSGQIPLERYGMTETMMLCGNPYEGVRKPGTVGFPFAGVQLRVGDDGEVQVRGPNVIAGYYQRPDADAEAFTPDGWFRTGDLGEFDEDGYLRLVGRSKELIITGGFNVHPREVEEVLAAHPDVREVAVVGRPSERWGEEVTAVIVADRVPDPEELRALAAGHLAPYKVPKRFEFADELPRNALGKIVRGNL